MNTIDCSSIVFIRASCRFRNGKAMDIRQALGNALKSIRTARGLTQEDFSTVSSRTYLSTLERGLKSPTLDKLNALAEVMDTHPLTIMALTYIAAERCTADDLLAKIKLQLRDISKI